MPRIRTIKPSFFRHEMLQDLEIQHPHLRPMLVFAALWGHCDKQGVFPWRPRQLALDILPYVWDAIARDMASHGLLAECLNLLRANRLIEQRQFNGQLFGVIPTFATHQRITGRESQEPPACPPISALQAVEAERVSAGNIAESTRKQETLPPETRNASAGSIAEALGNQRGINAEVIGREEEQEGKGKEQDPSADAPPSPNGAGAPHSSEAEDETNETPASPAAASGDVQAALLPVPVQDGLDDAVRTVHLHYVQVFKKRRYDLTEARRAKIKSRLADRRSAADGGGHAYTVADLCRAIDAMAGDDWERRSKFCDLADHCLHSREMVEKWLERAETPRGQGAPSLSEHDRNTFRQTTFQEWQASVNRCAVQLKRERDWPSADDLDLAARRQANETYKFEMDPPPAADAPGGYPWKLFR